MTQILYQELIKIKETTNFDEICDALGTLLYVPDVSVKPQILYILLSYLREKFELPEYRIKVFIAYSGNEFKGFIICKTDPYYTSYGRKCGVFGWIFAEDFITCKNLMKSCEEFVKQHKIRKLRGPINFPKSLGGLGHQVMGFNEQILYGVAFNNPESNVLLYLERLGYEKESQYSCMRVDKRLWDHGRHIDKDIIFRYFDLNGVIEKKNEILELGKNSFHEVLPDASGRDERFQQFIDTFRQIPQNWRIVSDDFIPEAYSTVPQFIDAWQSCDLDKIEIFAPMAFDKTTGQLVGILLGLPDLYESWRGDPITRCNVDTAMVKQEYVGKGIFSALNNIGQLTANLFGISYFEGTSIWSNNEQAVHTIFPHCSPLRKHYIVQKRMK